MHFLLLMCYSQFISDKSNRKLSPHLYSLLTVIIASFSTHTHTISFKNLMHTYDSANCHSKMILTYHAIPRCVRLSPIPLHPHPRLDTSNSRAPGLHHHHTILHICSQKSAPPAQKASASSPNPSYRAEHAYSPKNHFSPAHPRNPAKSSETHSNYQNQKSKNYYP